MENTMQLTEGQAIRIARKVARDSLGFERPEDYPDVVRVAERAALSALREAGHLDRAQETAIRNDWEAGKAAHEEARRFRQHGRATR